MAAELEDALKYYLIGKNNLNDNTDKSLTFLKKALLKLSDVKSNLNQETEKYLNIINQTEAECKKILNKSVNVFKLINYNDLTRIKHLTNVNFRDINDKGNTILHHCIDIGDTSILKELLKKGGNINQVNGNGHTLLEYACLKRDPNIINFLLQHGANMKKHLFLRKNAANVYFNKSDIDILILLKLVISKCNKTGRNFNNNDLFSFLGDYLSWNQLIGIGNHTVRDLSIGLTSMFRDKNSYNLYKSILIEELSNFNVYDVKKDLDKIDIILFNLIPFINYPFNIESQSLLKIELKHLIRKNINIDKDNFKLLLMNDIFNKYIKNNLFNEDYIGIIVYQILSNEYSRKIKL